MDLGFQPEQSRIDIWEWYDKDGNIWFRIDDQGTGMTQVILSDCALWLAFASDRIDWVLHSEELGDESSDRRTNADAGWL